MFVHEEINAVNFNSNIVAPAVPSPCLFRRHGVDQVGRNNNISYNLRFNIFFCLNSLRRPTPPN